jgi:hypothetical protein
VSGGRGRTWLLVASLTLNGLGLGLAGYTVARKGGLRYLRNYRAIWRGDAASVEMFPLYWQQRLSTFWAQPPAPGAVIFAGDSLTEGHDWGAVCGPGPVLDRGIGADTTVGLAFRLDEILRHRPTKLFLLIGISDLRIGRSPDAVAGSYERIVRRVREEGPGTELVVQGLLPINPRLFGGEIDPRRIDEVNDRLRALAARHGARFLDVGSSLREGGVLAARYTRDGVHLTAPGYERWHAALAAAGCRRSP